MTWLCTAVVQDVAAQEDSVVCEYCYDPAADARLRLATWLGNEDLEKVGTLLLHARQAGVDLSDDAETPWPCVEQPSALVQAEFELPGQCSAPLSPCSAIRSRSQVICARGEGVWVLPRGDEMHKHSRGVTRFWI
jgi:hypothetical protein